MSRQGGKVARTGQENLEGHSLHKPLALAEADPLKLGAWDEQEGVLLLVQMKD